MSRILARKIQRPLTRHPSSGALQSTRIAKTRLSAYFDEGRCGHQCLGLHIVPRGKHSDLSERVPGDMQYCMVSLGLWSLELG